jgi:internalin A
MAKKILEILLKAKLITNEQLQKVLQEQKKTGDRIGSLLVDMGFIREDEILSCLSRQFGVPAIDLENFRIEPSVLETISVKTAEKYTVIPISRVGGTLTLAMADPSDIFAIEDIKFMTDYNIEPVVASERAILHAIEWHYRIEPSRIEDATIAIVPEKIARHYKVIPIYRIGETLTVAMSDPSNESVLKELRSITNYQIEPFTATEQDILNAIERRYIRYYYPDDFERIKPSGPIKQLEREIGQKLTKLKQVQWNLLGYQVNEQQQVVALCLDGLGLQTFPQTIFQFTDLTVLNLKNNQLAALPAEIGRLTHLTHLDLGHNQLNTLPPEIGQLTNLTNLDVKHNGLTILPAEIGRLTNLTDLDAGYNQLSALPPEIGQLVNLTHLHLGNNQLNRFPVEIGRLTHLTDLDAGDNQLDTLPSEIGQLTGLTNLSLENNQLSTLPDEIKSLTQLMSLDLKNNQFSTFPSALVQLPNLVSLDLSHNRISTLLGESVKLATLNELSSYRNQLNRLVGQLKKLEELKLDENPFTQPPLEIVKQGPKAIGEYLLQLIQEAVEHNEAKLLLVGQGEVGKTCLARQLIFHTFQDQKTTEGIDIWEWDITAPTVHKEKIKLNVWDFGGQEIYHATHQFFLTKRSVYLLVWNARKSKDYEHIYYWLHTISAFGEDSPIILVLTKVNERDDDLNMKDLKERFPQVVGLWKVDSETRQGIPELTKEIRRITWQLPHMRTPWVKAWFNVRERLEQKKPDSLFGVAMQKLWGRTSKKQKGQKAERDWITAREFQHICESEGLNKEQTDILDEYLHDLGVIIHFRDRLELRNMVILKPEWATDAVYKVLDTQSVRDRNGILLHSELGEIWDANIYPPEIYPQLLDLMNTFELAYRLPDGKSHLVAELLPSTEPDFGWKNENNLCFYYRYDFLPAGVITRFIVRVHEDLEAQSDGRQLCWREGAILRQDGARALVRVKPVERFIEIRIAGSKKRELLAIIRREFDHIHKSIKKIKITAEIPCNCSKDCPHRFNYEQLLKAEELDKRTIDCPVTWNNVSISALLDGYERKLTAHRTKEIEKLNKMWELLHQKISRLEEARIIENDPGREFSLEHEIAKNQAYLQKIEQQLAQLESR